MAARERFEQRAADAETERDQAVAHAAELEARLRRKAAIALETLLGTREESATIAHLPHSSPRSIPGRSSVLTPFTRAPSDG